MSAVESLAPEQRSAFFAHLERYGLSAQDATAQLDGKGESPVVLDTSGGTSAVKATILTTNSIDQMREWLNPDGEKSSFVRCSSTPFHFAAEKQDDDHAEIDRLTQAAYDFVFHGGGFRANSGDAGLKSSIEKAFGTMSVAVFAGDTVVVRPGSPLVIKGTVPVALNYAEMDIYAGGQVLIYAPGTMTIQVLKKFS